MHVSLKTEPCLELTLSPPIVPTICSSGSQSVVPGPASSSITWELVRNANSQAPPRPTGWESLWWSRAVYGLMSPLSESDAGSSSGNTLWQDNVQVPNSDPSPPALAPPAPPAPSLIALTLQLYTTWSKHTRVGLSFSLRLLSLCLV